MGDTGVVIYSNSVFGARTNYEGGPAALAAALTGRTPRYGFHLDQNRRGTRIFRIKDQPRDWSEWGALGGLIGRRMGSYFEVPVIEGVTQPPTSDDLKHFGESNITQIDIEPETESLGMLARALANYIMLSLPPSPAIKRGLALIERAYQESIGKGV